MMNVTMKQVKWDKRTGECTRWEATDGRSSITRDEFGYAVEVNGTYEHTETLRNALNTVNDERYYR